MRLASSAIAAYAIIYAYGRAYPEDSVPDGGLVPQEG